MDAKTYQIPLDNVVIAQERLQKLERTANRLGLVFPTVTISEPYRTQHKDSTTGEIFYRWWRDISLEGEGIDRPVSYGGWSIIGQFNHQYPKVILNKLTDDIVPYFIQRFEAENVSWCEHCNKSVRRNNTYVVRNETSGAQMLVGSSCMHHYVPHQKSLDAVMGYYLTIHELFNNQDEDGIYGGGVPTTADTRNYLRLVFQILLTGVDIKSDVYSIVMSCFNAGQPPKDRSSLAWDIYHKAKEFYFDALSEMDHMMEFISSLPQNNDFNVRLVRMCEAGYHLIKDSTTVRWGAVKYYEFLHKGNARLNKIQTNWVGEIGEMIEQAVTYVDRKFLYSGDWGDSYLYIFKTEDGSTITWKTSYIDGDLDGKMIIRGRIKELTEYEDVKQTQITRAKLRKL